MKKKLPFLKYLQIWSAFNAARLDRSEILCQKNFRTEKKDNLINSKSN